MDVTECLLNPKIVAFLEFLWYHYVFCAKRYDSLEKVCYYGQYSLEKVYNSMIYSLKKV